MKNPRSLLVGVTGVIILALASLAALSGTQAALAETQVESVDISGPPAANYGELVTYTISYSDVRETGGIAYTIDGMLFDDFIIQSVTPEPNYGDDQLTWPTATLNGSITISGWIFGCGTTIHTASIYDTHHPGTDLPSDSVTTEVANCGIYQPIVIRD